MSRLNRRTFIKSSALGAAAAGSSGWLADLSYGQAADPKEKNDRMLLGSIGVGGRGSGIMNNARSMADLVAVADVDRKHAEKAKERTGGKAEIFEDYRKLLDRKDIDVVTIGTPDHWHTKIVLDALAAGKDVYCEKPLTLTVAEGQQLVEAVEKSGKVLQVGTQQRSEYGSRFLRAVATVRSGQLGKLKKVTVSLPLSTASGGPFKAQEIPKNLNWNFWLGQAPLVDYCPQRCHFNFRWWFEYSGGIMTDWGAHHMDIAQWAIGAQESGPRTIDGAGTELPNLENGYNTPKHPSVKLDYDGDVLMEVTSGDEGILFEGDKGRIYVNRGRITGKPIEEQDADKSLADPVAKIISELYPVGKPGNHMKNFFECVRTRQTPISDVVSQHRSVSACHLANISCRLGRKLIWDPKAEKFQSDEEATAMLSREQRSPYQI